MQQVTLPTEAYSTMQVPTPDKALRMTYAYVDGITFVTVEDEDGVVVASVRAVKGQWLIPYKHLSLNGNFRFESDTTDEYPTYKNFQDFKLVYYTSDEVDEIGW